MLKFITEFGPVIAFFIGYKFGGISQATIYMLIVSSISFVVLYLKEKKVNKVSLISIIMILASGGLTLFTGNSVFIKMKPTILYLIFATIFFVTTIKQNPAIRYVLGHTIKFRDNKNWNKLNIRFIFFFLFMAIINESIWRNFDESFWVNFKLFGAMPLTIIFIITQIPFIVKNQDNQTNQP